MLYVNPLEAPHAFEHGPLTTDPARRRMALQEMEQYFARLLLREMRATVPQGGLFPRSAQQAHFEEMLDDALSAEMAESGQLGLARLLEEQLRIGEMQKKLQRTASPGARSTFSAADFDLAVK